MSNLRYVNFKESYYHGMTGDIIDQGERVSTIKLHLKGHDAPVTFYNHQLSKSEIKPFG